MMKSNKVVATAFAAAVLMAGLAGCQKQEGPMERAGKQIDKATEKAGQQIDKAAEKSGQQIERAGEKIQEVVKGDKK